MGRPATKQITSPWGERDLLSFGNENFDDKLKRAADNKTNSSTWRAFDSKTPNSVW